MISVPVIVVFTKYEDFWDNIRLDLEDKGSTTLQESVDAECEKKFQEHYYSQLPNKFPFVKLERELLFLHSLNKTDCYLKVCMNPLLHASSSSPRQLMS